MRLQQDAIKHLFEALQIQYHEDEELIRIREIVDSVIINASKEEVDGVRCANGVTRLNLSRAQFTLWTSSTGGNFKYQHVQVLELIHNQRELMRNALSAMLEELHQ